MSAFAPVPGPAEPDAGMAAGPSAEEFVRMGLEAFRAAAAVGGVTEQERLILEQIGTLGQKLLAGREKQDQALLGGPAQQALARAYGGAP